MQRLPAVSSRVRTLLSRAALSLAVASTTFTNLALAQDAAGSVVVRGASSARGQAIVGELRARGFVVTEGGGAEVPLIVVADDGAVVLDAFGARESFASTDEDGVVARRVAESLRARTELASHAAEAKEPEAKAPPETSKPAEATKPVAASEKPVPIVVAPIPTTPAKRWFRQGQVLLSVDEAFPILSVGGASPLAIATAMRTGSPQSFASSAAATRPLSVDVAILDRVTVGGAIATQVRVAHTKNDASWTVPGATMTGKPTEDILDLQLRAGVALPISSRLALWPRIGGGYARDTFSSGFRFVGDVRLVWTVAPSWALTLGPSLVVPLSREPHDSDDPQPTNPVSSPPGVLVPSVNVSHPLDPGPSFGIAVGVTARLDDDGEETRTTPPAPPRVLISVERALPLLRYRFERLDTAKGETLTLGTSDASGRFDDTPRFAVDGCFGDFTLGIAGAVGYQRASLGTDFVPNETAPRTAALALAPRLGYIARFSRRVWFWPRAGLSFVHTTIDRNDKSAAGQTAVTGDLESVFVFSPVEGVGLTIAPALALPIFGEASIARSDGNTERVTGKVGSFVLSGGLTMWL